MRLDEPRYIDSVMVIALVLLVTSAAIAVQHYMAPKPAADIRFETVRY
jgi:hypothetical protein